MWRKVNLHFVRDGLNPIQLETSSSAVLRGLANWKAKGQLQTTPTTGKRRKCLILFQFSTTLHFGGSRAGAIVIARINALKLLEQGTRLVPSHSLGWDALWSIRKLWPCGDETMKHTQCRLWQFYEQDGLNFLWPSPALKCNQNWQETIISKGAGKWNHPGT